MRGKSKWIAIIILLGGLFWFSCDQIGVSSYTNPGEIFSAIPEDSPYILEIKDIHNLLEIINDNNEIHNSFLELDSYKSFFNDIILIDSLIKYNPNTDFNNFSQPILITSGTSGNQSIVQCETDFECTLSGMTVGTAPVNEESVLSLYPIPFHHQLPGLSDNLV